MFPGLGPIKIRNTLNEVSYLIYDVEVVEVDVPLLIGLEFLEPFTMAIELARGRIVGLPSAWRIPLVRKTGHLFIE